MTIWPPGGASVSLPAAMTGRRESCGCVEVVEGLYQEHYESLYRYLALTGSSPADADELAQEGFLRLLRELLGGKEIRNPRGWLFRIVHNLRVDQSRRAKLLPTESSDPESACPADHVMDPESDLLRRERVERLQCALNQLTERQRQILLLRAEGLKLREIADMLGISLQAVSDACARAVDRVGRLVHG